MCHSVASLLYGQAVRTSSLLFAADAFPHLEPVFRFIDLVSLRLRRGRLEARAEGGEDHLAVEKVPAEVWELVRDKVVDLELEEAEQVFVDEALVEGGTWASVLEAWDKDGWSSVHDVVGEVFYVASDFAGRKEKVPGFLAAHGLALPPDGFFLLMEDPAKWRSDPRGATLLTLPLSSIPDVSFSLPSHARQRFVSLIRLFHLEPLQIDHFQPPSMSVGGIPRDPVPTRPRNVPSPNRPRFKFVPLELGEVNPGWKLHTTCTGCY
ncbi:hypothetical protein JCM11251_004097 [Rhodosporidiobolus azoricus]